MEKIPEIIAQNLSGKLGDVIFVKPKGKNSFTRKLAPKPEAGSCSVKQQAARTIFGAVVKFANDHKETLVTPIWNKRVKELKMIGISGFNFFVKTNRPAFDASGKVGDHELLHFSNGKLPLPYMFRAEIDPQNPQSIVVSWFHHVAGSKQNDDCLMSIIYHDGANVPVNTGYTRKDQQAVIVNPTSDSKIVYLYLYSWNKKLDLYSPDQVFTILQPIM